MSTDNTSIVNEIKRHSVLKTAADGKEYAALLINSEKLIAKQFGLSQLAIQIIALEHDIIPERYQRNIGTIGLQGQIKLLQSTVAVIGAGGLGGIIIELLARMGVGKIIVVDGDVFSENNLNRQVFSAESVLGLPKAEVTQEKIKDINSAVNIIAVCEYLDSHNALSLLKDAAVIVDALDNLQARFVIADAANKLNIPLVHGAIGGFCGHVTTIMPGDETLKLVYGGRENTSNRGVEVKLGNPAATPLMIAAWEVQETVKIITGVGTTLHNKLLYLDAENGMVQVINLK